MSIYSQISSRLDQINFKNNQTGYQIVDSSFVAIRRYLNLNNNTIDISSRLVGLNNDVIDLSASYLNYISKINDLSNNYVNENTKLNDVSSQQIDKTLTNFSPTAILENWQVPTKIASFYDTSYWTGIGKDSSSIVHLYGDISDALLKLGYLSDYSGSTFNNIFEFNNNGLFILKDPSGGIKFSDNTIQNNLGANIWTTSGNVSSISGLIGIKNTNPTYDLHINGDLNFTGNFILNGSIQTNNPSYTESIGSSNVIDLSTNISLLKGTDFTLPNGVVNGFKKILINANSSSINTLNGGLSSSTAVNSITPDNSGNILIGGSFTRTGDEVSSIPYAGRWNNDTSSWSGFGSSLNSTVNDIACDSSSNVYVAISTGVRKWSYDTSSWSTIGTSNANVASIYVDSSNYLYAAGSFTLMNSSSNAYISRWDPNTSTWGNYNSGMGAQVNNVCEDASNNILFSGNFTSISGQSCRFVARSQRGTLLLRPFSDASFNAQVNKVFKDISNILWFSGSFSSNGSRQGQYLQKYNGTTWFNVSRVFGKGISSNPLDMDCDSSNNFYYVHNGTNSFADISLSYLSFTQKSFSRITDVSINNFLLLGPASTSINSLGRDTSFNLYIGGTMRFNYDKVGCVVQYSPYNEIKINSSMNIQSDNFLANQIILRRKSSSVTLVWDTNRWLVVDNTDHVLFNYPQP